MLIHAESPVRGRLGNLSTLPCPCPPAPVWSTLAPPNTLSFTGHGLFAMLLCRFRSIRKFFVIPQNSIHSNLFFPDWLFLDLQTQLRYGLLCVSGANPSHKIYILFANYLSECSFYKNRGSVNLCQHPYDPSNLDGVCSHEAHLQLDGSSLFRAVNEQKARAALFHLSRSEGRCLLGLNTLHGGGQKLTKASVKMQVAVQS